MTKTVVLQCVMSMRKVFHGVIAVFDTIFCFRDTAGKETHGEKRTVFGRVKRSETNFKRWNIQAYRHPFGAALVITGTVVPLRQLHLLKLEQNAALWLDSYEIQIINRSKVLLVKIRSTVAFESIILSPGRYMIWALRLYDLGPHSQHVYSTQCSPPPVSSAL